nr:FYVE; RhoGEF and PH domain-containing protein 6-like isoform X3 [Biomphalaria glabrata]
MTSLSAHEDENSLRKNPLGNIHINKPLAPRSPEKPPVAAKPKLAPPPPPKPLSLSPQTPKVAIPQTLPNHSNNYPKALLANETFITPPDRPINGILPENSLSKLQYELENDCINTSPQKPPLPTSPPRVPSRGSLSPSSSSSLPASFRRKKTSSTALLSAQSQMQVCQEFPSPTSCSSISSTPHSDQETISAKVPPSILPKPKVTRLRHPESSASIHVVSSVTHTDNTFSHSAATNGSTLGDQGTLDSESYDLTSQSSALSKSDATTEQLPPTDSNVVSVYAEDDKKATISLTKATQLVLTPPILNTESPLKTATQPVNTSASKTQVNAKAGPPPLPKNPPRGNIPRKPRNSSSNRTPTSDTRPAFPATSPPVEGTLTLQGETVHFSKSLDESPTSCVTSVGDILTVQKSGCAPEIPKTAPKPRPRTKVSSEIPKTEHPVQDQNLEATSISSTDLTHPGKDKVEHIPVELEYVEVYRGDTEDLTSSLNKVVNVIPSESTATNYSKINSGNSAISESGAQDHIGTELSCTHLDNFSSLREEVKDEDLETTCGMLKEIEELLKTKLGEDLKLDAETAGFSLTETVETVDGGSSSSTSPVRPPRPKHKANIVRHIGSLESLTGSIDSSSTECLSTAGLPTTGKKIPPKPKRSFLSRINRSHSDASDIKSVDSDLVCSLAPVDKPYLPPRSDSLRRSESLNSTTPPPLPPRNKPHTSTNLTVEVHSDSETSSSAMYQEGASDSSNQSNNSGTLRKSDKPIPKRQAPPPPPGPPKRSSTFSPGDARIQIKDAGTQGQGNVNVHNLSIDKRKSHRRLSIPDSQEQVYHEIADHMRTKHEESPPPELPPRSSQVYLVKKSARTETKDEKHAGKIPLLKVLSPEDQKNREKKAKNALVQKVTQSLGLGKITKKSKSSDNTNDSNSSRNSSFDRKINPTPEPSVALEASVAPKSASVTASVIEEEQTNVIVKQSTELAPDSSAGSSERPLSVISQHSSISGDGEQQVLEETPTSSDSESEPEPDKEEIYAQRKAKKVFFIAKEIMSSEHNFVDVLKLLNLDFRVHISKATEKLGQPVIPTDILNKILDLLPQLLTFNEDLLKDITERVEKWDVNPKISDIFVKKGPFLKLYSTYIGKFENATELLESATKKYPAFMAALKEFEMSPRCANLALKHYMLKPIQRIPQYKLLLQDYLKNLSPASNDYKDTVTALNIVSEVADHANESMRQGDNVQNLLEVQRSLVGQWEVIQPGRVLIKKGELQKLSRKEMQPRMFILFNDVLLHTTAAATGYKINNILPLTGMRVSSPKLEVYKFEFNIICVQRSFTLSASSSKEKEEWVTALQTAIDTNAKKHHTFEAFKPGPQTSLHDKDFVLGSKAPLWVPDGRVTMCMLCLVEFTLTWRRHHCRSCGRIVCSQCSDNKAPLRYLKDKPARVCDKCFDTLKEALEKEIEQRKVHSTRLSLSQPSDSPGSPTSLDSTDAITIEVAPQHDPTVQNLNELLQRFQKIRVSNRKANTPSRPSVLKEVQANDEGSDISGYLRAYKSRKWKKLWFVLKGKVLYTYKASEDMAAVESMPLLGYEVTRLTTSFEGADADQLFELTHQNKQPVSKSRAEKTTQRLIFRTDNEADTIKWVNMLAEAAATPFT